MGVFEHGDKLHFLFFATPALEGRSHGSVLASSYLTQLEGNTGITKHKATGNSGG